MSKNEQLVPILAELLNKNIDIQGALVATSDGIAISSLNLNEKSNRLAAMASACLGLGKQVISTVNSGVMNEITVSGNRGQVFVYSISTKAVLVVVTKETPNVAMVNWESHKTVSHLSEYV